MKNEGVKLSIGKMVYWLLLIDLIWGGTGRVVMFGPLSFRMVLLALSIVCGLVYYLRHHFVLTGNGKLWAASLFIFFINLIVSIAHNPVSYAVDEFTGYITIIIWPFILAMNNIYKDLGEKSVKFFHRMTLLFAMFSIGLWIYAYRTGVGNYTNIRALLDRYVYGSVSYVGGGTPRLFLKSSIFLSVGLLLSIRELTSGGRSFVRIAEIIIYVIAIITTFTTSFYVFSSLVVCIYILHKLRDNNRLNGKTVLLILVSVILVLIVLNRTSAVQILLSRFTGDYTFSYKTNQIKQILDRWLYHPIFGTGFGSTLDLYYGYTSSIGIYRFEVMWLQLLYHTGLIGFIAFVAFIVKSFKNTIKCSSELNNDTYYIMALTILFISLVSFTNPFMNNSIGLIAFSLISGASESKLLEMKEKIT